MAKTFSCPQCGKTYSFKPEMAGKSARCKCGNEFTVPAAPEEVLSEADLLDDASTAKAGPRSRQPAGLEPLEAPVGPYESASAPPPSPPKPRGAVPPPLPASDDGLVCRNCRAPLQPGAVICMQCGMNIRTGQIMRTDVDRSRLVPKRPTAAPVYVDDALSTTDWLLILFCGIIALIVALQRGFSGGGWRMLKTMIMLNVILIVLGMVLGLVMGPCGPLIVGIAGHGLSSPRFRSRGSGFGLALKMEIHP